MGHREDYRLKIANCELRIANCEMFDNLNDFNGFNDFNDLTIRRFDEFSNLLLTPVS